MPLSWHPLLLTLLHMCFSNSLSPNSPDIWQRTFANTAQWVPWHTDTWYTMPFHVGNGSLCVGRIQILRYLTRVVANRYRSLDRYMGHTGADGQDTRFCRLKMRRTNARWAGFSSRIAGVGAYFARLASLELFPSLLNDNEWVYFVQLWARVDDDHPSSSFSPHTTMKHILFPCIFKGKRKYDRRGAAQNWPPMAIASTKGKGEWEHLGTVTHHNRQQGRSVAHTEWILCDDAQPVPM